MNTARKRLPWFIAGTCVLLVTVTAASPPPESDKIDLGAFRKLPVVERGRIKPIDTAARTALRAITGKESLTDDSDKDNERKLTPFQWYLEIAGAPKLEESRAWDYKFIRVENDQVLNLLKLKPREGFRYSLREILGKRPEEMLMVINKEAARANQKQEDHAELDMFDRHVLKLSEHLGELFKLVHWQMPLVMPPTAEKPESPDQDWQSLSSVMEDLTFLLSKSRPDIYNELANDAETEVLAQNGLKKADLRRMNERQLAFVDSEIRKETIRRIKIAALQVKPTTEIETWVAEEIAAVPAAKAWIDILKTYRQGDGARFQLAVEAYRANQTNVRPRDVFKANVEVLFNASAVFYWATGLYVIGAVLTVLSWGVWTEKLRRATFFVLAGTLLLHTVGLLLRMYLQGRPPVTNLYSSALFIGYGCVWLGLILERIFPNGVGNLVASTLGFLTCIIAHNLGSDRDTLEMMQAVLDTNFWLATHVTIVTLGYTATFVSGLIGTVFLIRGVFTPSLDDRMFKQLGQMLYGVICFAMMLSFVGTVLGGIWADQSWGRFWGWDSKENGAVLVVIWNALILHARWSGLIQQRGMAVLAVGGNMVTAWSWFGTNMLGVGLHSYGFLDKAVPVLVGYWISQLMLMGIGLIPPHHWRSFGGRFDRAPAVAVPRTRGKGTPVAAS